MNKKGLSGIEVFCITGICIIAVILVFCGLRFYHNSMAKGNDALKAETAQSTASMNLASSGCVVNGCGDDGKECTHIDDDGYTHGYYDAVYKKILPQSPQGYNEYRKMKIGEKTYSGKTGTMVIEVRGKADGVRLTWIEGDN